MTPSAYCAPRWLRNPHLQSVLASSRLRRWLLRDAVRRIENAAKAELLDCGDGVRLTGRFNRQSTLAQARGLVVLFHGWEGSVDSSYLLRSTRLLLDTGFDVFRLNFRDHGGSHALNPEIFHSCRIAEVLGAVRAVRQQRRPRFLAVAGFSLGGNFALRVALHAEAHGIALAHAVAICPIISPAHGLQAMEQAPWFYQHYFMHKWQASLRTKQRVFPGCISDAQLNTRSVRALTEDLALSNTAFETLDAYLDGYSVAKDRLREVGVPISILTAADDPIIPLADFESLQLPAHAELEIAEHGGHCGFLLDAHLNGYAEQFVLRRLLTAAEHAGNSTPCAIAKSTATA